MATKKEEKEFEKERKAAIKARYKKMKEEGLEKYLTLSRSVITEEEERSEWFGRSSGSLSCLVCAS